LLFRQNIISNQKAIGFNKRQLIKLSVRQELIRVGFIFFMNSSFFSRIDI